MTIRVAWNKVDRKGAIVLAKRYAVAYRMWKKAVAGTSKKLKDARQELQRRDRDIGRLELKVAERDFSMAADRRHFERLERENRDFKLRVEPQAARIVELENQVRDLARSNRILREKLVEESM